METTRWLQFSLPNIGFCHNYVQRTIRNCFFLDLRWLSISQRYSYRTLEAFFLTEEVHLGPFQIFMM